MRITHERLANGHLFTSPDLPELHVFHVDEATARAAIPDAVAMIERMKARSRCRCDDCRDLIPNPEYVEWLKWVLEFGEQVDVTSMTREERRQFFREGLRL